MNLPFPNDAASFRSFFETLAITHKSIRHKATPERENFCVVQLGTSVPGLTNDDVREFLKKVNNTRAKMEKSEDNCQMVVIAPNFDAGESEIKVNQAQTSCSFLIISKPYETGTIANAEANAKCHIVGREIMSAIKKFFALNIQKGKLIELSEESSLVNDYTGWRFDMVWRVENILCYDATKFNDLTLAEL